jgi:DNA-binding MarR family transcriptional regulator
MHQEPGKGTQPVSEAVLHSLIRMWGLLRQIQEPYFAHFGISASQWGILRVLQRADNQGETSLPLTEVSRRLLIQPPSVTGVVNRLERQGLVKRSPSKLDLRVRHLSLTQKGRNLISRVLEGHAQRTESLFAGLQKQDQQTLLNLLRQLESHLGTIPPRTRHHDPTDATHPTRRRHSGDAAGGNGLHPFPPNKS